MPWLTVEQNVSFAVKSSTRRFGNVIDSAETAERARLALSQVRLSDVAEASPSTLSGGMKQRVAIARLLAMGSEVMLMDEPFSALDELTRSALDESMRRLWKRRAEPLCSSPTAFPKRSSCLPASCCSHRRPVVFVASGPLAMTFPGMSTLLSFALYATRSGHACPIPLARSKGLRARVESCSVRT